MRAFISPNDADHVAQAAPDRLKVDVVLEQRRGDAPKLAAVLRHRRVLELQHDRSACNRAGGGSAIRDRRWRTRGRRAAPAIPCPWAGRWAAPATRRRRRTSRSSSLSASCAGPVQQFDHVNFRQLHHLAQRLVHEDAAAVDRRADGVGRNEQHAQALGSAAPWRRSDRGSSRRAGAGRLPYR